jgi:hypothetical protein
MLARRVLRVARAHVPLTLTRRSLARDARVSLRSLHLRLCGVRARQGCHPAPAHGSFPRTPRHHIFYTRDAARRSCPACTPDPQPPQRQVFHFPRSPSPMYRPAPAPAAPQPGGHGPGPPRRMPPAKRHTSSLPCRYKGRRVKWQGGRPTLHVVRGRVTCGARPRRRRTCH